MVLEKYRKNVYSCSRCGYCREAIITSLASVLPSEEIYGVCPVYEAKRFDHYCARGILQIARWILEGYIKYTPSLSESIYMDLGCGACKDICRASPEKPGQAGIDTPKIVRAMRQDMVRVGLGPPDPLKEVDSNVEQKHNVFGQETAKRPEWAKALDLPKRGVILYFAGCYPAYRYPKTAKATVSTLKQGGVNVAYLGEDEWCCGVPELWDGNIVLAEELMKHNVDAIKAAGAKKVVTSCAGCYHTLKTDYPEIIGKLPFEVVHSSELIADMMEKGKIELKEEIQKTFTYHDPCHLGRHEGVYDPPRKILRGVKGAKFVEMLRNKAHAWCCGGGSIVHVTFPELSAKIAGDRVSEASDVKAEGIVTACSMCMNVLTPAAKRVGIEVYDLSVIVAKAMGLSLSH